MVLGIDLGTTYSVAAYMDENGNPCAVYNSLGSTTTPSVVYFEDDHKVIVGQNAKYMRSAFPKQVVSTVKNVIGDKNVRKYTPFPESTFLPQDISSFVLRKLVKDAENTLELKQPISDVVVTVPAYFTDAQRTATNEAVKLAGLNLIANVNEPTAAAVFYAYKSKMEQANTLVFDLGGGTFDVTVIHINNADVEVKSTHGLKNVGGSFFDEELVEYVCEQFEKEHGIDLEDEEYLDVYNGLFEKVENAKKMICSNRTQTSIPVSIGSEKSKIFITYDYFVSIISKLCDKIENLVKRAIDDAGFDIKDIDQIIMVGGSSRIPYIEERITQLMGKKPLKVVNPDEAVALGAAIQAERLAQNASTVKDVCSHGIGFLRYSPRTESRINVVMIPRNMQLPAKEVSSQFAFAKKNQEYVKLILTEGDYEETEYVDVMKELKFELPDGVKKGMEYFIEIAVDELRTIRVTLSIPDLQKKVENIVKLNQKSAEDDEQDQNFKERAAALEKINID